MAMFSHGSQHGSRVTQNLSSVVQQASRPISLAWAQIVWGFRMGVVLMIFTHIFPDIWPGARGAPGMGRPMLLNRAVPVQGEKKNPAGKPYKFTV